MRVRPKEHASMSSSSQVIPNTPDVLVRNEGTVFLFCPLTSRGKQWIEEHVQPDAQWFGSALVVEHRFASWLPESVLGGPIHSGLSACVSTNRPQGSPRTRAIRRRLRNMPKKGAAAPSALELDRASRRACSRRLFSLLGHDLSVPTQSLKARKRIILG